MSNNRLSNAFLGFILGAGMVFLVELSVVFIFWDSFLTNEILILISNFYVRLMLIFGLFFAFIGYFW